MENTFENKLGWDECRDSDEEMKIENEPMEDVHSEIFLDSSSEPPSIEEEISNKCEESMERMLNSFSDMLQTEIHQIAEELNARLMQNLQQTSKMIRIVADELMENYAKVIEQQEVTIQKQHQSTTKFQEDVLYKIQKNLIMELIDVADNIRMILLDQQKEQNYDVLLQSVKSLEEWVSASLSNNSVRSYRDTDECPTVLNRKRQEVVDTEITDNPAKNNMYVSERPGYIWTMPYLVVNSDVQLQNILKENERPQTFSFVIRPEEVIKLKYDADSVDNNW